MFTLDDVLTLERVRDSISRAGNPYHDDQGHFTGAGGHAGRRPHKKHKGRKKRKLERFRGRVHKAAARLKAKHKEARSKLHEGHKKDWHGLRKEHSKARKALAKSHAKERLDTSNRHKQETRERANEHRAEHKTDQKAIAHDERQALDKATLEHQKKDLKHQQGMDAAFKAKDKANFDKHDQASAKQREQYDAEIKGIESHYAAKKQEWKATHEQRAKEDLTELKKQHSAEKHEVGARQREENQELHSEHKDERKYFVSEVVKERGKLLGEHKEQREQFKSHVKSVLDKHFPKRKSAARGFDDGVIWEERRFSSGRTTKASSAEAILRQCLRSKGWTRSYRLSELSGEQHLELLEEVRQYGRSWLRHEAEELFRHHSNAQRAMIGPIHHEHGSDPLGIVDRGLLPASSEALSRFFRRAKTFVHELILSGAMAMGGPGSIKAGDYRKIHDEVQKQVQYLDRFEQEVKDNPPADLIDLSSSTFIISPPPMSGPQFVARAEMYGNSVWQTAQKINRKHVADLVAEPPHYNYPIAGPPPIVQVMERRVLGHPKTEHCHDCPPLAAKGWQPVGSLPDIGDSECGGLCLCHFEFSVNGGKPKKKITGADLVAEPPPIDVPIAYPPKPDLPPPSGESGGSLIPIGTEPPPPKPKFKSPPKPRQKTQEELIQEAGGPWPGVTYHYEEAE